MKKGIILIMVVVVVIAAYMFWSKAAEAAAAAENGLTWDPDQGKYVYDPDGFIAKKQAQGGFIGYDDNGNPVGWAATEGKILDRGISEGNAWSDDVVNVPLKYKPEAYTNIDAYLNALHSYFVSNGKTWTTSTDQSARNYFNYIKSGASTVGLDPLDTYNWLTGTWY